MAQKDQFPARGATTAAREFFAITPNNDTDLPQVPRAVYVGGDGNIALIGLAGSDSVILKGVKQGQTLVIAPSRILATGTTAADLIGLV